MSRAKSIRHRFAPVVVACLILVGIGAAPAVADTQIAALRRATAAFHDIDVAMAAGWSDEITGCLESPDGGMGYHYVDFDLLLNADLDPLRPEALLYEPQKNGMLRLVAVEYVIPDSFLPSTAPPPSVLGHELHYSAANGAWILHVWLWRHNPSGMFADWNPRVSCEYAD